MKKKSITLTTCLLIICMLSSYGTRAQRGNASYNYTYKVFQAPDKMFGYDVFLNSKGVFHQPAAMLAPNNAVANKQSVQRSLSAANDQHFSTDGISRKEVAENAALLSIEKIKKRLEPSLTNDEMKQLVTNTISTTATKH